MNLRINRQIRAPKVRVIGPDGSQVGLMATRDAIALAEKEGLDLVEIAPNAEPPVCKIINFGKYRYDQTKKEKESKKSQHQIKVKEIKLKPNIDEHDFLTKQRQAKEFLEKGNKVKITCFFRGREAIRPELGEAVVKKMCSGLEELGVIESPLKMMGKTMIVIVGPKGGQKTKSSQKEGGQKGSTKKGETHA